ncbi:MAG: hypothetical protein E6767_18845 [Dysgonomonas sp.]|nr:hypothetical protein [Dysgonomonas sp.]
MPEDFNTILAIISLAVAVIAIIISILVARHYHLKDKTVKIPLYYIDSRTLISPSGIFNVKKLKVLWDDKEKIKSLTSSVISIWNSGNVAIRETDFSKKDVPIKISLSKGKILEANLMTYNYDDSALEIVVIGDNVIEINFHHLDAGRIFDIEVLHTDLKDNIYVKGNFIDIGDIQKSLKSPYNEYEDYDKFIKYVKYIKIFMIISIILIYIITIAYLCIDYIPLYKKIIMLGICVVLGIVGWKFFLKFKDIKIWNKKK